MRDSLEQSLSALHAMERPWGINHLKRLGKAIRESDDLGKHANDYDDVMLWYNDLAVAVQVCIEQYMAAQSPPYEGASVTSRSKTIDTLAEKLRRTPQIQLPSVRDVAGVRLEAQMTLHQQTLLANELAEMFGHDPNAAIRDLRQDAHSGYRAVHLWLDFAGRVEVQIRTHLQGAWANAYESAGDALGRGIRYDELPEGKEDREGVLMLQSISLELIAPMEDAIEQIRVLNETVTRQARQVEEIEELRAASGELGVDPRIESLKSGIEKQHAANLELADEITMDQEKLITLAQQFDSMYTLIVEGR